MLQAYGDFILEIATLAAVVYLIKTIRGNNRSPHCPPAKAKSEPQTEADILDGLEDLIAERLEKVEERYRKRLERASQKAEKGVRNPVEGDTIGGDEVLTSAKLYGILHGNKGEE